MTMTTASMTMDTATITTAMTMQTTRAMTTATTMVLHFKKA